MTRQAKEPSDNKNTYALDTESTAEMIRLLRQDMMITKHLGSLFPEELDLTEAHAVLDAACGPGGWAQEVAFHYPEIDVTGIDISRTMLSYAETQARVQGLRNVRFLLMNVLKPLEFPDNAFDVVNGRFMASFMPRDAWIPVLQEFLRVTKPGGTLRLTEFDEFGKSNSVAYTKLQRLIGRASLFNGQSFSPDGHDLGITPMLGLFLKEAGCELIREKAYAVDFSAGTEAQQSCYDDCKVALKLLQPYILKTGITTQKDLDDLYNRTLAEMLSNNFRAILSIFSAWGRKSA